LKRLAFVLAFLITTIALADKLVLKDGRTFEGEITQATATSVTIKLKLGEATFKRDQIASIEYTQIEKPSSAEEKTEPKPYPQPKDEKQVLVLINKYLRENDEAKRKRLADALQPVLAKAVTGRFQDAGRASRLAHAVQAREQFGRIGRRHGRGDLPPTQIVLNGSH